MIFRPRSSHFIPLLYRTASQHHPTLGRSQPTPAPLREVLAAPWLSSTSRWYRFICEA